MVRWAAKKHRSGGAGRSSLGPQARGIFDRLFGAAATPESRSATAEALSVAIASGKGGTGKSFLATNLGVLLHQAGRRVCIVDCDFGLACDHLLLGVSPRLTLQDYVSGRANMADLTIDTPAGPRLVPGAQGVRRMASLTDAELLRLAHGLGEAAADHDVMILDVGAGISPQTMLTMLAADHLVLVTEPEIAALTDAYAVIKCIAQLRQQVEFSVVVNRVAAPGQGRATFAKLDDVSQRYTGVTLRYLGEVGFDPAVTHRRLGQRPLSVSDPAGATAAALRCVTARLEGVVGGFGPRSVAPDEGIESRFRSHRLFVT